MTEVRFRDAALIYNPLAGYIRWRRQRDLTYVRAHLEAAGMQVTTRATLGPGSATALAREQVERHRDLIIACGGDGTVNEIVNGMVGSNIPLAILPAGTANVLAKELKIPRRMRRAVSYIPTAEVRRVALGRAGPRYFICLAGVGPDAHIVYQLSQRMKLSLGQLSYWLEGLWQLFAYDFPRFEVDADGQRWRAVFAVISRTRHYGGPIQITRRADFFGSEFEVALFTRRNRLKFLLYLAANWLRLLERFPEVRFLKTSRLRCVPVDARARIRVEVDGELAGMLPCEFEVIPATLSLLVPRHASV